MTRDRVSRNDHAIAATDVGKRLQVAELESLCSEDRWRGGVIRQRIRRPERRCLMKRLHRTGEIQNLAAGEHGEDHSASGIGVRLDFHPFVARRVQSGIGVRLELYETIARQTGTYTHNSNQTPMAGSVSVSSSATSVSVR